MAQHRSDGPRVAPSQPKGSGRRAPRVLLALLILLAVIVLVGAVIAVLLLRA